MVKKAETKNETIFLIFPVGTRSQSVGWIRSPPNVPRRGVISDENSITFQHSKNYYGKYGAGIFSQWRTRPTMGVGKLILQQEKIPIRNSETPY